VDLPSQLARTEENTEHIQIRGHRMTTQDHQKPSEKEHPVREVCTINTTFMTNHFVRLFVQYHQAVPSVHPSEESARIIQY
jgi:hypothetical protein